MKAFYTLLGLGLMLPAAAQAAPQSWRVSERSGTVTILHSGASKIALQGAEASPGDVVATGANGRAVLVRGDDYLVVAPSSRLRIAEPSQKNSLLQVLQDSGNVVYKIKHLLTPHFSVETPYLAAVVKGTTFSITVSESGTAVQVVQGALEVQTVDGGARELIRPGMIARITAADQFRLKIEGDNPHTVSSPNAPAPEKDGKVDVTAPAVDTAASETRESGSENTVITSKISEADVSISKLTGGLIEGNASFAASMTNTSQTVSSVKAAEIEVASLPPTPAPTPADIVLSADPVATVSGTTSTTGGVTPVAAAPVAAADPVVVTPPPVVATTTTVPVVPAVDPAIATPPTVVATTSSPVAPVAPVVSPAVVAPPPVVAATTAPVIAGAGAAVATPPTVAATTPSPVTPATSPAVVTSPTVVASAGGTASGNSGNGNGNSGNGNSGNGNGNGNGNNGNGSGNVYSSVIARIIAALKPPK